MSGLRGLGAHWLADLVEEMVDNIELMRPVIFNEEHRYIPAGVSPRSGFIRYDLFPYLREPLECFDPRSPVREMNFMKGVQVGYTTLLESILLYYIAHLKNKPFMFLTAEKELATQRVEDNIIPMLNESDFAHLIRSSDEGNNRKTGKSKNRLQWEGGGFGLFDGAMNAKKMRQVSVPLMLKDELDGWKRVVGDDGNSDNLTDARLSAYWGVRKIARGSTPLIEPSMIGEAYDKGDQRKYMVLCKACSFPQYLKRDHKNTPGGFKFDLDDNGGLINESVRYCCMNCGHEHYETDKSKLFAEEHGAHWKATASPKKSFVRSYHLPSFYSPFGFRPWYKCIGDYLDAFDPETGQVKSIDKLQEYYNNTCGVPFRILGSKLRPEMMNNHRRPGYRYGTVPNKHAIEHTGGPILFLTCQVDVHKKNLAVSVMGWTAKTRCYLIDYYRDEPQDGELNCTELDSPVWGRLMDLIESKVYEADNGTKYGIMFTLVDANYCNDTVTSFCANYETGVVPILGREKPAKNQSIKEFAEFKTQLGTTGFRLVVDHYKDRMSIVLKREWYEEISGQQMQWHFNAPIDSTDEQLKELTTEIRRMEKDDRGNDKWVWHRPGNAPNELWDLLGYGFAAVDIVAWSICIQKFKIKNVNWFQFWEYASMADYAAEFCRV